jgi:hypothetical protein
MRSQQHLAYALQWFGLAFVLTIIFIKFRLRKNDNTQQRRNRQLIIGIFLLSIIPFTIAWILAKNPTLLKFSATNHGQLIVPIITTQPSDYKGFDIFSENNLREISFLLVDCKPYSSCRMFSSMFRCPV